ncbi:type II toxin-antitoxin system PemK/MazF family toxin [Salisaeta longa]|uniref:type II toxin-antitoxin system PemK/MazF family toxin n=1 Tax=Salisaeta longa TaxID=503170 RepID=UPI0012FC9351
MATDNTSPSPRRGAIWRVRLRPTEPNGPSKVSAADALQIRGVDTSRFVHRMGRIASADLENIIAAVAAVIEYK